MRHLHPNRKARIGKDHKQSRYASDRAYAAYQSRVPRFDREELDQAQWRATTSFTKDLSEADLNYALETIRQQIAQDLYERDHAQRVREGEEWSSILSDPIEK